MVKDKNFHKFEDSNEKISSTILDDLYENHLPPAPLDELSTELLKSKVMSLGLDYYIVDTLSRETLIEILDETLTKQGIQVKETTGCASKVCYDPLRMEAWLDGLKLGLLRKKKKLQRELLLKHSTPTNLSLNQETSTDNISDKLVMMSVIFLTIYLSFLGAIYYLFI